MPTYEYACKGCGQHLEVVQSFKDDPLIECPNCGAELRKVFGSIGITFKGSGFYRNDSRSSTSSAKPAQAPTQGSKPSQESKTQETQGSTKPSESTSPSPAKGSTDAA